MACAQLRAQNCNMRRAYVPNKAKTVKGNFEAQKWNLLSYTGLRGLANMRRNSDIRGTEFGIQIE